MAAKRAIQILRKTGKLGDALIEALRGQRVYDIAEAGPASQQSQVWYVPNQMALNQFTMRIEDKLPDASYSVADTDNGSVGGYSVTVSGVFMDGDVASLSAGIAGITRLDGPNSDLS